MADMAMWRSIFGGVESALVGKKPSSGDGQTSQEEQKQGNDDAEDEITHSYLLTNTSLPLSRGRGYGLSGGVA